MDFEPHVGENAELYAVGALDEAERTAVDEHIAECAECLRRVGEAEETVLALECAPVSRFGHARQRKLAPLMRRSVPSWWIPIAAAAALVVGLLIPHPLPQHDRAMLAMIGSHFSHAQFSGSGPPAKVLYARDRSWYYVIVAGRHRLDVYGVLPNRIVLLGQTQPDGDTSTLFTPSHARFERLELREKGTRYASAAIR